MRVATFIAGMGCFVLFFVTAFVGDYGLAVMNLGAACFAAYALSYDSGEI